MRYSTRCLGAFGALSLLGLAGCQTGPTLSQRLHAYIGQPETAIVQGLGIPQRAITTGGIKYLAYDWQSTAVIPGGGPGWGWGGGPWGPWGGGWGGGWYQPTTVVTTACEATFQMGPSGTGAGEVAVAVILRGNACE
ncbi:hypothetical protein [Acidisoma silvae]|uniref:Uncharacterized protein n=1 Tax=Acidisoma silvae TaxID=2802396 RepID=A0A963YNF9_9PROT|nr:hypothetical protein [Acidisoma silvae]MCB8874060.1 hypothetical protein [Acidisoma silvae]